MNSKTHLRSWIKMAVVLLFAAAACVSCEKITDDDYDSVATTYRTNGGGGAIQY